MQGISVGLEYIRLLATGKSYEERKRYTEKDFIFLKEKDRLYLSEGLYLPESKHETLVQRNTIKCWADAFLNE